MEFIELNKQLKEKIENVYNIKGNDVFLIKQAITNLKTFLIKDLEELNYIKLDASKMKVNEAEVIISTLPFANDYRLVVLEEPNVEIIKLINKFDFEGTNIVIVCINADKGLKSTEINCEKLDRTDIVKYILNYLAKRKLSIHEQALDYIIDATNGDMSKIVNELNKLSAYACDEGVINMEIATNLVANSKEYVIYMLTNAIDAKDYAKYQEILTEISKSQSVGEVFSYMGKYFKRMQYIALSKDDEDLAKILGVKPYAIKMSRKNIATNGVKFYVNLYQKYVDLDYDIKSGKITPYNALYKLVF